MRASKGGLTHDSILRLTWRQFGVYLDAYTNLLREESGDDGEKQKNADADLQTKARDPRWKQAVDRMRAKDKKELARHKRFAESRPTGGTVKNMLDAGDLL